MNFESSLALPEKPESEEEMFVEEGRGMDKRKKKILEKQNAFELSEVENKGRKEEEEQKEKTRERLLKWIVGSISFLFLIGLYFFLVH